MHTDDFTEAVSEIEMISAMIDGPEFSEEVYDTATIKEMQEFLKARPELYNREDLWVTIFFIDHDGLHDLIDFGAQNLKEFMQL